MGVDRGRAFAASWCPWWRGKGGSGREIMGVAQEFEGVPGVVRMGSEWGSLGVRSGFERGSLGVRVGFELGFEPKSLSLE